MQVYEGMFILDPSKYSRDPAASAQQVADIITTNGGTILAARLWDERKLAYPIKGHKKGVYWLTYFKMPGTNIAALERPAELVKSGLEDISLPVPPTTNMISRRAMMVARSAVLAARVRMTTFRFDSLSF